MNIFKRALTGLKAYTQMRFPRATSWLFGWAEVGQAEYSNRVGDGLDSNLFMSPLLWIARTFPEARLSVRKESKDGKTTIERAHAMARLVRRPNTFYSGDDLLFATIISFLSDGNAYWLKVRGKGKEPKELWYAAHWMVEPKGSEREFITHYEYTPGGVGTIRLEPEDVIHFRFGIDPRNPRKGFHILRVLIRALFSDDEAERMVAALLKNRGIPGLVISPEKDVTIDPKDEPALKQAVIDKTTGSKRGEALLLAAAVKVQQFGFNPQEMDLANIRNTPEERVCAMLGLPAAVVGFGTGNDTVKVGATMREYVKLAWTGCLRPLGRAFASTLTMQLLPDFDQDETAEAFFDDSDVEALQADQLVTAQVAEIELRSGAATRAEARKRLGHEVTPADDVFYIPFNAMETPRNESSTPPAAGAASAQPELPKHAKRLTRVQARVVRANDAAYKRFEPLLRKKVTALLERMGQDAERAYLETSKAMGDEIRVSQVFSQIDLPKYKSDLRGIFASHYVAVHNDNMGTLAGLGIPVNLPDTVAMEVYAQGGSRERWVDLSESGKARALRVIAQAREEGLGIPETARLLRDAIPGGPYLSPKTRAEVIARTETRFAQTQSSLRAYRTIEGASSVMMLDARLGATDQDCEELNGQIVSFNEAQRLLEQEHPNGTRDLVPVFEEA